VFFSILLGFSTFANEVALFPIAAEGKHQQAIIESYMDSSLRTISGLRVHSVFDTTAYRVGALERSCVSRSCVQSQGEQMGVPFAVFGDVVDNVIHVQLLDVEEKRVVVQDSIILDEGGYHRLNRFSDAVKIYFAEDDADVFQASPYSNSLGYDGVYHFDVLQPDVEIEVDNVISCTTPCSVPLKEGLHQARFSKSGFRDQVWYFHTRQSFLVKLEGSPTQLVLENIPRGSVLRVDGKETKYSSNRPISLSEGKHQVEIEHSCYEAKNQSFEIQAGETFHLDAGLNPITKKIYIPSNYKFPIVVEGKVYGYTGSPVSVPSCASFVHYGKKTAHISKFEVKD